MSNLKIISLRTADEGKPFRMNYYTLLVLRARVKLECAGMTCRGRSTSARVKEIFGLPKNAPKTDVANYLDNLVNKLKES